MSERLGDIYYSRDFPVLAEIGRWEAAGRPGHALNSEEIANTIKRFRRFRRLSVCRLR